MRHVADWETVKERYEAWWTGKLTKGPILKIQAPSGETPSSRPPVNQSENMEKQWLDVSRRIEAYRAALSRCVFLGDEFPHYFVNFGPGIAATYLNSEPVFAPDTVWFNPLPVSDLEEIEPYLKFDPKNPWWKITCAHIQAALHASQGDFMVSHTDLGGVLDILASLRGTEKLLTDLIEQPEVVKRLEAKIIDLWFTYYDELRKLCKKAGQDGAGAWMGLWAQETWYPLQCDFSAMISPDMFAEFVAPNLRRQCQRLTHSVYHWDGPDEIPHLDHLLAIDELEAIQWTPGAGNPGVDSEVWLSLYRRIAERGKGVVLLGARPDRVKWLTSVLPAERLLIGVSCKTQAEAEELMA